MAISDFELIGVEGKKYIKPGERINKVTVNHNSTVTLITEHTDKDVYVNFRFTATFVGIGVIGFEGRLLYKCEPEDVIKQWRETGNMPAKMATEVHSAIMNNCIPEAVLIARELKLPPPIPLPSVKPFEKPVPKYGVEVA
jgi:hypothetical protein